MPRDEILPAGASEPFQIGDSALCPRDDEKINVRRDARIAQVMHGDIRLAFERFEIRIVRDAWEVYHSNSQWLVRRRLMSPVQHCSVFLRQSEVLLPWHHADYRGTDALLKKAKAGFQQLHVAAELVDQHSLDAPAPLGREQLDRADD